MTNAVITAVSDNAVSAKDPKLRVSGRIMVEGKRLGSLHAYLDGRVVYSKEKFNKS